MPQQCCRSSWTPNLRIMNSMLYLNQQPRPHPPKKRKKQKQKRLQITVTLSTTLVDPTKTVCRQLHSQVTLGECLLSERATATVWMLSVHHSNKIKAIQADGNQSLWIPLKPYVASSALGAPSEVTSCLAYCCSSADRWEGWCCSREAVREVSIVSPLTSSPWTTVDEGSLA